MYGTREEGCYLKANAHVGFEVERAWSGVVDGRWW
jgi:hypothetical protein